MDKASKFITVRLPRPMGIHVACSTKVLGRFGTCVHSIDKDGAAHGRLMVGDQIVAVQQTGVVGMTHHAAVEVIQNATSTEGTTVELLVFRGTAKELYRLPWETPEWLDLVRNNSTAEGEMNAGQEDANRKRSPSCSTRNERNRKTARLNNTEAQVKPVETHSGVSQRTARIPKSQPGCVKQEEEEEGNSGQDDVVPETALSTTAAAAAPQENPPPSPDDAKERLEKKRSQLETMLSRRQNGLSAVRLAEDPICNKVQGHIDKIDEELLELILG